VLIDGELEGDDLELAARLTARFGQGRDADAVSVAINERDGSKHELEIKPMAADEIPEAWYL